MKLINYFLDTKQKRELIFTLIFLFILASLCLNEIIFFSYVFRIDQLEALYDLIPIASISYLGRIAVYLYQLVDYSILNILEHIIRAINPTMIISLLYMIYFIISNYQSPYINLGRKTTIIIGGLLSVMYIFGSVFIYSNITMTTYNTVLVAVRSFSVWIIIMEVIQLIVLMLSLIVLIRQLLYALQFEAVEIEDYMEE